MLFLSFSQTAREEKRIIECEITQLVLPLLLLYIAFRSYKTISILACCGCVICTAKRGAQLRAVGE